MYRLSYRDLQWEPVFLEPSRYTVKNGVRTRVKRLVDPGNLIRIQDDVCLAVLEMPAGQGKISDAGYDQMACLAATIPAYDHVLMRASIRVLRYPLTGEQNGQEGVGLFFRDTMAPDPENGYPYSNMAAAGIFRGTLSLFGRQGVTETSIEHVKNLFCPAGEAFREPIAEKKLTITLEKQQAKLRARIVMGDEGAASTSFETAVGEGMFSQRAPGRMAIGFLAARGCRMEVDLGSVSIEYEDWADAEIPNRVLYASPEGTPFGDGTLEAPLDLQSAIDRCRGGQEIRALPGLYRMTDNLVISKENSGSCRFPKRIRAENVSEEWITLDFGVTEHAFCIEGDYWDISDFAVTRGFGFVIRGSCNRIHDCQAFANLETGFLIRHPRSDSERETWPSGNEVRDCISWMNCDRSEQHADGFACKVASGSGNRFVRCTALMNSDDGFDLFSKNRRIGSVSLKDCCGYLNGYLLRDGKLIESRGNGNGFKLGGSGLPADHEAVDCEASGNRGYGFTSNSNPHMRLISCRAENNRKNYAFYYTGPEAQAVYVAEDCTERDDPGFDPTGWMKEHILGGSQAERLSSPEGHLLDPPWRNRIIWHNNNAVRSALKTARSSCGETATGRAGLLIMCSSLYGGGAERVACRLASGLAEKYRVVYLYNQDKGQSYPLHPRVQTLAMPFFYGSWDVIDACRAEFVRKLKEMLHIEASVSFMYSMNKANVQSGGDAKIICSERNNPVKRYPEHLQEVDALYAAADHVVFQSETVRDMFSPEARAHSSVILNPVDVTAERTGSRHRIVNVGRLIAQKNQAMLIRAFAAFYSDHKDYTLSFYGAGELYGELKSLADSLGLENAVQFHGQVWDVHAAVADAEMFVLSSDYEGLSNALLECMMMGLPCISTRCDGSKDVIRSGENGILVDIGSEEQLTDAMRQLAEDLDLRNRLGAQARKDSEKFGTKHVIEQWEELIGRLIGS